MTDKILRWGLLSTAKINQALIPPLRSSKRNILTAVTLKGASGWRVQIAGELGLSDGAPDHAITLGASRRF